ncbi:MAG: recombinase family protein [Patescibacteria group bacterium]|jgi:site-specific DNA recombinase
MTTNETKTKYALYCRKSTEDSSRQILSLDSQEKEMLKLAENLELDIVQVFRESKSAKKPDNRPQFSELINLIKKSKIDGIICWKIDRLSRNPIDSATIQWLLQQGQLKIIQTMERQYLPSDNALLFNVESGMANQYILDLSKNVKRGIKTKLEKGGWPNLAPIGYLNKDSKIIIDKVRGKYITRIFELYRTGKYSVKEISDILFTEGFRSRAGKKYHKSKIHKMLSVSFYCGIMEKDGQLYKGSHEPLISKKLFDEVQEMLNKKAHIKRRVIPFAFRGILKCANCGCQLTATKKKGRLTYYYCTNGKGVCNEHKAYLREESISKELSSVFAPLLFDEKIIELVYRAKLQEQKQGSSYLEASLIGLRSRLKKLEERKNALLDAYLDKALLQADFEPKNESLNNEIMELKKNIEELESQKMAKDNITLERIKNLFLSPKNMKKLFLKTNSEQQKEILNSLLWNAEISNKKIANISYKEPYNILSKIENKSDFSSVRRERDSNPRYANKNV